MPKSLKIALAGLGTVGVGVVRIVQTHAALLQARTGCAIEIAAVSARSRTKNRDIDLSAYDWEDDPVAMARRDDIDLLVEVIGGENGPAKAACEAALASGKHVVTANKALLARHGQSLAEQAEASGAALRFDAAVAGGIPVVKALTEGLAANRITRVLGVMNGTCNYILTTMEASGESYDKVLEDAKRLGYAEADPGFDVGGIDAAQKLALLSAIAFGTQVNFDGLAIEGIERISLTDIEQARDMGYSIKLLGSARMTDQGLEQRMQPCLVPEHSPLGQLDGVTNMVVVEGDFVGQTVYQGPGAGEGPTASAIMADVIDIARGLIIPPFGQPASTLIPAGPPAQPSAAPYYLRLDLADAPGTLAKVATVLGENGISINRMRQYDHDTDLAPVLIVTHSCAPARLEDALEKIAALDVCSARPVAIRIES